MSLVKSGRISLLLALAIVCFPAARARAEGDWEVTPDSEAALERGLKWLARNQGPEGNWGSNHLGLVGLGALAFMSAGHMPGHGPYGDNVERALDFVLRNAKRSGLLNIADKGKYEMYNHGLATFVLGQAYGMTDDPRIAPVLASALKLIADCQCGDGRWHYSAVRLPRGHDLSLSVMQAKALRSAVDSGFDVPPEVVRLAIKCVRDHYRTASGRNNFDDAAVRAEPGHFTYDGHKGSVAMAACGVVCLQEFGEYDDWRIPRSMDYVRQFCQRVGYGSVRGSGKMSLDAFTLYYVAQALYQSGGDDWEQLYPKIRDNLVLTQRDAPEDPDVHGSWEGARITAKTDLLYGTSVACFVLAIPNRYLPILQEGGIYQRRATTGK